MAAGKWNMQKASGGVASITVADGTTNTDLVLPESGTVATTDNIVGFKNYIINGGFNVNQYPAFSNSSDGYKFDRWGISASTTFNTMSQIQLNGESSSNKALSFTKTSNSTSCIWTRIEFPRILAGKTVTLSFRAYSNTGHDMLSQVYFDKYNPTDGFTNATTGQTFTWNNSWSKRTMTFTLPTLGTNFNNDNSYFQLNFSMTGTTTGAYLTDVQLEEGSVATPFEQRPYGLELSLCQRYYQVYGDSTQDINIIGYSIAGQTERTYFMFPIQMRDNPNATRVGTWYASSNCSQPTIATKSKNGFSLQTIVAATGGFEYACTGTGQYLIFEKEL